jgi:preprotein translocase subunit SecG
VLKVLFVLVALIMTFFILLQEGKGGGLAALGGTKAASVEGVTNPIRRATAVLAVVFFVLAILIGVASRGPSKESTSGIFDAAQQPTPEAPAPGPGMAPVVAPAGEKAAPKPDEPKAVEPGKETKAEPGAKTETKAEAKPDAAKAEPAKTESPAKAEPAKNEAPAKASVAPPPPAPPADAPKK